MHATELLASTLISGHKDCALSITECASRKSALVTFKERLLKQYTCIFGSNFCHRQKDRLLIHEHKGSEIPVDLLKQILNIWVYSSKRKEMYEKLFDFESYFKSFCVDNKYPPIDVETKSLGIDEWDEKEIKRLRASKKFAHYTSELRSHSS